MPLYEYVCRGCHTNFEALVPASHRDASDSACPRCGETKTARKISLIAYPVVKNGGSSQPFDCGASGGCCGGACGMDD